MIHEDQTEIMANLYVGDNIRLIYDLINYLNTKNASGLLLCLDFEKAFDSVDWKFMFKVLCAFGFGSDIRRWISTFYKDIKSSVEVKMDNDHKGFLFRESVDMLIQYHRTYLIYA